MTLAMSRPWRDPNTGIWYLRKRVPKDLLGHVGRAVHKVSLGTKDPAEAKRRHVKALADLESKWTHLRAGSRPFTERDAHALAASVHDHWLAFHRDNPSLQFSWQPDLYPTLWTAPLLPEVEPQPGVPGEMPITNIFYRSMRRICFQKADELLASRGLVVDEWGRQKLAKAIGAAYQRASLKLARQAQGHSEPDESVETSAGDRTGSPMLTGSRPISAPVQPSANRKGSNVTNTQILEDWWREAKAAGRKPSTYESYRNTIRNLIRFLGHDDATRVTPTDVVAFKDHRLATPSGRTGRAPSAKTVKDSDLSALKTLFGWAVANHRLSANPATGVTIKLGKTPRLRSKGFTDAEAQAILHAAFTYKGTRERPCTAAAKRWVPWLCAFTGARVGEIAQLRKQDVRHHGGGWAIHITPEAGTQKTNEARDVPLHPKLTKLGFPAFVESCPEGHLFLTPGREGNVLGPLQAVKNRLAEFARSVVTDRNVAPNHGWRHRFKTIGMEAGIAPRILDAIQGQAARSVADTYGDVTLRPMAAAISNLPSIEIGELRSDPASAPVRGG